MKIFFKVLYFKYRIGFTSLICINHHQNSNILHKLLQVFSNEKNGIKEYIKGSYPLWISNIQFPKVSLELVQAFLNFCSKTGPLLLYYEYIPQTPKQKFGILQLSTKDIHVYTSSKLYMN